MLLTLDDVGMTKREADELARMFDAIDDDPTPEPVADGLVVSRAQFAAFLRAASRGRGSSPGTVTYLSNV